jgi:hypothetical protein
MLYREIIAVCSQIHTKHINTQCGQKVELLNVKLAVHIVTTGLFDRCTTVFQKHCSARTRMKTQYRNLPTSRQTTAEAVCAQLRAHACILKMQATAHLHFFSSSLCQCTVRYSKHCDVLETASFGAHKSKGGEPMTS